MRRRGIRSFARGRWGSCRVFLGGGAEGREERGGRREEGGGGGGRREEGGRGRSGVLFLFGESKQANDDDTPWMRERGFLSTGGFLGRGGGVFFFLPDMMEGWMNRGMKPVVVCAHDLR